LDEIQKTESRKSRLSPEIAAPNPRHVRWEQSP
jgi:hypothetical protein